MLLYGCSKEALCDCFNNRYKPDYSIFLRSEKGMELPINTIVMRVISTDDVINPNRF